MDDGWVDGWIDDDEWMEEWMDGKYKRTERKKGEE